MLKNDKLIFLLVILLFVNHMAMAQKVESGKYVILTVEDFFSKSFEGGKKYFFIVKTDSIKSLNNTFSLLITSGFSKRQLENCCTGIDIDPFTFTMADSTFKLGEKYIRESDQFDNLVLSKRKKIQTVKKEWIITKSTETITFYVTPIKGKFCSSEFEKSGQWKIDYSGKIFIPYSSFELDVEFWDSEKFQNLSRKIYLL